MKTQLLVVILAFCLHFTSFSQCGINSDEILSKNCKGILLRKMEMDNGAGQTATLMLKKDNSYIIYLLNASSALPKFKIEGIAPNSSLEIQENIDTEKGVATYQFTPKTDGSYVVKLDFNTNEKACVLVAVYLYDIGKYKRGIYKSFEEFKYNNPSLALNIETKRLVQKFAGDTIGFVAQFDISRQKAKEIENCYGFCDGNNIFLARNGLKIGARRVYDQIEIIGCYGYYRIVSIAFTGNVAVPVVYSYLVNLNTGEVILMTIKSIKNIIENNIELLTEFNNDKHKRSNAKEYLIRYFH